MTTMIALREGTVTRAPSAGNGGPQDGKGPGTTPGPTGHLETLQRQMRVLASIRRMRGIGVV